MASYLRQYTAARKTWIEVLNAQRELAQARYTAIDTTYGLKLAFYKLDILTGVIHKSPHMK
jgi:adhesin transport system outer membrane protein